jgi:DNA-binding NtrC family response regulator
MDAENIEKFPVVIVSSDPGVWDQLKERLRTLHIAAKRVSDIDGLKVTLKRERCLAVMIDLDSVHLDNQTVRELALEPKCGRLFCMSEKTYHPDLTEAIRHHFFACLLKPVNPDELEYWLRCIASDTRPVISSEPESSQS